MDNDKNTKAAAEKARGALRRLFNFEGMTIDAICRALFIAGLFFVLKAACLFGAQVCSSTYIMREISEGVSVGDNNLPFGIACGAAQFIAGAALWRAVCALLLKGLCAIKKRLS